MSRWIMSDRDILFCRYPVPGRTKTRLIPLLGRAGAAELQRRMTEETLSKVKRFSGGCSVDVEVCFEGGDEGKMERWLGPGLSFLKQVEGDLGRRMEAAFDRAFQSGCRRVVLHGIDIPKLDGAHLQEAFDALGECDLVLGPSEDGGYWLIGLKGSAELFRGIEWGTSSVLQETLRRAEGDHLTVHLLPTLSDVDTPSQWRGVFPDGDEPRPYLSVVIPTLDEGTNIEATIGRASCDDAEIIVVDAGSKDDTAAKATSMGATLLVGRRGRGAQQNLGARASRGRVLLFLHGDTLLPDSYADKVFETLLDPGVVAGGFKFRTDLDSPLMRIIEFTTHIRSRYLGLPYGDQALFMRRDVFDETGGFPECALGEDFYLVRRLSKKGRIAVVAACIITSGRRWRELGVIRTTFINQVVAAGLLLGFPSETLARIYRRKRYARRERGHKELA
jgi:uncharacterized protein